jgi:hypothetical protein
MTGSNIDGSLRRAQLPDQSAGTIIPDSRAKLDDNPFAIMEPGAEDISLNFEDKKGLTDAYGNTYAGYSGGGGATISVGRTDPAKTVDSEADDANPGDILQFDDAEQKYLPVSLPDAGLPNIDPDTPIEDGDILVYDLTGDEWVPRSYEEESLIQISAPAAGDDILRYNFATKFWDPSDPEDFFFDYNVMRFQNILEDGDIALYNAGDARWEGFEPVSEKGFVVLDTPPTLPGGFMLYDDGAGRYVEVDSLGWIQLLVAKPENKSYTLAENLPFAIQVVGVSSKMGSGPGGGNVSPGGYGVGNKLDVSLSGTNGSSKNYELFVAYKRTI